MDPPMVRELGAHDAVELGGLAAELATEAGVLLLDGLATDRRVLKTKSSPTDLVTEWDRRSEALIVDGIRSARPDDGILGEEGTQIPGTSGVRWIVDPLDGTTNYLYGLPGFGVSIAVETAGRVTAAAVNDPVRGELFTATEGGGAFRDNSPIRVSDADNLATSLVGTGFAYEADTRRWQAEVLTMLLPAIRDIRRQGAAAVDLCSVACGRLDGHYEHNLAPWDLAAGVLIAEEAGALAGDLADARPSSEFAVVAGPGIFDDLRSLLHRAHTAAETPVVGPNRIDNELGESDDQRVSPR